MKRESRGLGPWVVDHGRVTRSTVHRRRCRQKGDGAWELVGKGRRQRGEHGDPVVGLTGS
jgi:hypothetical protein